MYLSIRLLFIISLGFGANYFQPDLSSLSRGQGGPGILNIPDTLRLIGIMAQFSLELPDNPKTSGNGQFLSDTSGNYIKFFDSNIVRCDGFLVDRPPHNKLYFQKQLEAVGNYYENVSDSNLLYTAKIISNSNYPQNGYYTVSDKMESYAKSDQLLAQFFTEVLELAQSDIEDYIDGKEYTPDEVVFVVFHAGLSQDFIYPSLDPTVYDLKSAYIDQAMMQGIKPSTILQGDISYDISSGILLPETQNIIYYNVVEDIFGNPDYGTDDLCDIQIGLVGIFAFLLGYELGLPEMFNPATGDPRIGFFGLMDHGSNNGRGVIPVTPNPWTRSLPDFQWSNVINLYPIQDVDDTITVYALDSTNTLNRIDINENEYFLIENRNHWVFPETDIDSLRRKNKIDENLLGHWFDSVIDEFPEGKIQIDEETQVIIGFDHYDYGLPGSGILIWHIKEPIPSIYNLGVNNDVDNRHIQLEEADGAQDIGTRSYSFFASDDPTTGTRWDMWFIGNEGYEYANPGIDKKVIFDKKSSPNTLTTEGAESFTSIEILSEISDVMTIRVRFNEDIEIINLSDEPVQYLGNAYDLEDSTATIYYEKNGKIYLHASDSEPVQIDTLNYIEGNLIYTYKDQLVYFKGDTCIHPTCEYIGGEISSIGYINSVIDFSSVPQALSLGDIDLDGLDEIITIDIDNNILVKNSNGTLVNGFPVDGDFSGVPLIANILPPLYGKDVGKPEIVCREGENIIILSNKGERLRQLSSYDIDQPLSMVPFWNGDTILALIDGSRLFLFDWDMNHSYWLNPRSQPSGFPLPTGLHELNTPQKFHNQAYNYPNPITEGETTFRFYVGSIATTEVQVKIYNAAGYLVEDDLIAYELTPNEFNEIQWNASQVDAGLYFAEIKPDVGSSELVRLVVIK